MQQTRTRRQREVLDFIMRYIDGHGYEPSYQLIARHLGLRSKAGIARHVKALEEQGLLERRNEEGRFKLIMTEKKNIDAPGFAVEWLRSSMDDHELEEWELVPINVPHFMLGDAEGLEFFAYRMRDEAMAGKNIISGDVVLIAREGHVRDGSCVAVTVNEKETILRSYYRDGANIELRAANIDFPSIRLFADQVEIRGTHRGLIRPQ